MKYSVSIWFSTSHSKQTTNGIFKGVNSSSSSLDSMRTKNEKVKIHLFEMNELNETELENPKPLSSYVFESQWFWIVQIILISPRDNLS